MLLTSYENNMTDEELYEKLQESINSFKRIKEDEILYLVNYLRMHNMSRLADEMYVAYYQLEYFNDLEKLEFDRVGLRIHKAQLEEIQQMIQAYKESQK
jgi:hypothetical protein